MAIYYHFQVLCTVHNCMCCTFIRPAGFFTLASAQTCNVLHYDVVTAAKSLGDRKFWGVLYIKSLIGLLCSHGCRNLFPQHSPGYLPPIPLGFESRRRQALIKPSNLNSLWNSLVCFLLKYILIGGWRMLRAPVPHELYCITWHQAQGQKPPLQNQLFYLGFLAPHLPWLLPRSCVNCAYH